MSAFGFGLGLVLAGAVWAGARHLDAERWGFAVGLAAAAAVYLVFALVGGAGALWVAVEALGMGVYGGLAWAGWRGSARWLVLGWALHPAWDLGLHLLGAGGAFVPAWYAWACLSFDLVLAWAAWRLGDGPDRPRVGGV